MEQAQKIMSKNLLMVSESTPLIEAQLQMKKHNIRHLPVANTEGHIVGLISDRDLQRALRSQIVGMGDALWESCDFNPLHVVADYMTWPVKTVDLYASVKTVTELMLKEKVSSYLVTNEGQVAGIITTDDLLRYLLKTIKEDSMTWKDSIADMFSFEKTGAYAQALADSGI